MPDVIKTIESWRHARRVLAFLNSHNDGEPSCWRFVFNLGRGRPQREVQRLYFTFKGRLLGYFTIEAVEENKGQFEGCTKMFTGWSPARWVMVCRPPFIRVKEKIYKRGFQGWRYFDLETYRNSEEAKMARMGL